MNKAALALALSAALAATLPASAGERPSFSAQLVAATTEAAAPAPAAGGDDNRLLVAGLGAIGGIVAFNLAMGGTAALPFLYEAGAAANFSSGPVAASRVIAVSAGVAGALAADYFYRRSPSNEARAIPRSLSQKVEPR